MAGFVGIALRGFGKALKKGLGKVGDMSDKTAGTIGMTGTAGAVVGAGVLSKIKNKKESTKPNLNGPKSKKSKP
jgi:hypothetical protein